LKKKGKGHLEDLEDLGRWEYLVKKDVSALGGVSDWKERESDRDGWREVVWTGWS